MSVTATSHRNGYAMVRSSGPGEDAKFAAVVGACPAAWQGTVLDIGCRSGKLQRHLPATATYYIGADLFAPASIIANLQAGLPLPDRAVDTAVGLDVLEHTDDIHGSLAEMMRVANRYVVITLPNAYEAKARLRFAMGRPISAKYGLPEAKPADRHKWLFSFIEALRFTETVSKRCGFAPDLLACLVGPRRARFLSFLGLPGLFAPTLLAVLKRRDS
jgi:SAM-dependent methyltransferase